MSLAGAHPRLRVITDDALPDDELVERARAICRVARGAACVHLRDARRSGRELAALAERLREVTSAHGSGLVLGGRYELALRVRFDGFHGWRAPRVGARPVSVPVHDADELARAVRAGAHAALVSPIFETPGKGPPRGLEALREARTLAPGLFLYALGGVDAGRARACVEAGADGVAVVRAVFAAADPEAATAALLAALE